MTIEIPITDLEPNTGQVPEVPANPRIIKNGKFRKLMTSIKEDPEILKIREIVVFPIKGGKKFMVLGGNMRLKACIELGYKTLPCKVLDPALTPAQLRAFITKDNVSFGEFDWDMLANEWDEMELEHWGVDFPQDWGSGISEDQEAEIIKGTIPVVKLEITFDDLDYYADAKKRISELIEIYPGAQIKEK